MKEKEQIQEHDLRAVIDDNKDLCFLNLQLQTKIDELLNKEMILENNLKNHLLEEQNKEK